MDIIKSEDQLGTEQDALEPLQVSAIIVPRITCDLPVQPIHFNSKWKHLSNLQLADPDYGQPNKVDMLSTLINNARPAERTCWDSCGIRNKVRVRSRRKSKKSHIPIRGYISSRDSRFRRRHPTQVLGIRRRSQGSLQLLSRSRFALCEHSHQNKYWSISCREILKRSH